MRAPQSQILIKVRFFHWTGPSHIVSDKNASSDGSSTVGWDRSSVQTAINIPLFPNSRNLPQILWEQKYGAPVWARSNRLTLIKIGLSGKYRRTRGWRCNLQKCILDSTWVWLRFVWVAKIGGGQESGNGDRGGKMLIFKVHFFLALLEDFSSTFFYSKLYSNGDRW